MNKIEYNLAKIDKLLNIPIKSLNVQFSKYAHLILNCNYSD